ncbi:MAG: universal stress protein [Candidatus Saccharibacteria bacterium]|nr:universal stress protein [Candidatus Saccharibacteria bacterium]
MKTYHTILVAIDLTKESNEVIERAQSISKTHNSNLHIVHVVEPFYFPYNENIVVDLASLELESERHAKLQLKTFGNRFQVLETHQHLLLGSSAKKIHELADDLCADLIVVGSHGRSGFSLLLGSTANGVLHGSKCDVLAVRVATTT